MRFLNISVIIPTWNPVLAGETVDSLHNHARAGFQLITVAPEDGTKLGAIEGMAKGAQRADGDLLMFCHDDMEMLEPEWDRVIRDFFELEGGSGVGLVGFGGALQLGDSNLYKKPYQLQQLARFGYRSNMKDWSIHGGQVYAAQRAAVLDGFCQIFTREAYEAMGGWEDALNAGLTFHMYDAWAACRMKELGKEVWLLPLHCHHKGGLTSTTQDYDKWLRERGVNGDSEVHEKAHKIIYEKFRRVLPIRV